MPEERADEDSSDQESEPEFPDSIPQEECNIAEMKRSRKDALLEFRCRVEDAILGNYLFGTKNGIFFNQENVKKENLNDILLWGVPLLPSENHEDTDIVLLKFLKAKHYKVHEAFTLLRRTLKWRVNFNADKILEENLNFAPENLWFSHGMDKEGRPLCYNVIGKKSNQKFSSTGEKRKAFLRWRVQCLEKGIQNLHFRPGGEDSIIQIIDLKNSPGPAMKEVKFICKKMMSLLHDHYPGLVYKNLIINVPSWFMTLHALNLRLISQRSKNKFVFVKPSKVTETLLKYATPENILVHYGGLKRENDNEFSTNDKVLELNIRANSTDYIQIPINEVDVTITWDVTVVGYEVTYKEEFIPEDDCSYNVLLQKEKKMGETVRNSFPIREPGKIVITMTNASYTKKKVFYSFSFALRGGGWQQGQCQISRINAQEPSNRVQCDGGVTEFYDFNEDEFKCAGVSIHRHRVQARGLLLPSYHNAPLLVYIVQGRGIHGIMVSGCPETFESSQQSQEGQGGQRFRDRHQRIGHFKKGDIIAVPAGAAHWCYNDGEEEVIAVVLQDNANNANQLDQYPRSFFLAGNPERVQEQYQSTRQHGSKRGQHEFGNVFRGLDVETLSEAFGVDQETARRLQSEDDSRGHIIRVDRGLQVIKPPYRGEEYGRQEEEYGGRDTFNGGDNGLEETICTAKVRENLDEPSRADVYNPRAGRFSTVNSFTLPILSFLQLSASRGVLYRNAIMSPHWYTNAHSIVYVTRGEMRMQIVNHRGQSVFDGQVREGQVVVVPHNFAAVKQAGDEGCEWVAFNTNENAMINTLSGRTSTFRGLPVDVIANAYQISRDEAEKLKFSRRETIIFSGSGRSSRGGRVASA